MRRARRAASWRDTALTRLLGIEVPIVLAPMAGGPSTPALVAAVSGAGGLGTLGLGYLEPDAIGHQVTAVRSGTDRPFGVNLFVPRPVPVDEAQLSAAWDLLAPYRGELSMPETPRPTKFAPDFADQVQAVLEARVPFVTFTFGIPDAEVLAAVRHSGAAVGLTITTADEARAATEAGCDVLVAQGAEAGGHRGSFLAGPERSLVGLVSLVPQCLAVSGLPVLAGGGIMDGRGVAAALVLGAAGAQLGTAFLDCPEAGTSDPYRRALRGATGDTVLTEAISGRMARGLPNRLTHELAGRAVPPYPVMNALTSGLRRRAAELGRHEFLSLWAGQGVAQMRPLPAAQLTHLLAEEAESALAP
jgi:nitronate monooxygenase